MRRDLLIVAAATLVMVAVVTVGCLSSGSSARADITSVSTDRDLYHSNEVMKISINVTSGISLDNALLRIEGIEDRYGNLHISRETAVNLSPGPNPFLEEFRLPPCSSCAGIKAGEYLVNVTLEHDGIILDSMSHEVRLQQ